MGLSFGPVPCFMKFSSVFWYFINTEISMASLITKKLVLLFLITERNRNSFPKQVKYMFPLHSSIVIVTLDFIKHL